MKSSFALALALLLALGIVAVSTAQDSAPAAPPAPSASEGSAAAPAPTATPAEAPQPSAEEVLNELLQRRSENPLIEPARPVPSTTTTDGPIRATPVGTAPGVANARLLREGQFIITRRARLIRATGGLTPWTLSFEADKDGMEDPPMFLMPCRTLEDMEKIAAERGEGVSFIISGQVFVYRGANYLLPTLMKLAPDRTNLKP